LSTTRRTLFTLALAGIGAVLLVVTVRGVGWSEVRSSITAVGWWYPVIIGLGGLRLAVRARAWQACAGSLRLGFTRAFSATLAGDALGNLTPLGVLASEPAKVFFVNDRLATVAAVASVATENAFYISSVLVMLGAGALAFFSVASLPPGLRLAAQVVLASTMAAGVIGFWMLRSQPAILSRLARAVARSTGRAATAPDRLRDVEAHFYAALRWPFWRIARVALWEAAFHVAAVAEVLLVLRLLPSGGNVTVVDAFVLETTGRLIVVAFKFIPYRLGVDEVGSAVVARALALDPALGVTLALVRRIRVLCWNAVGLALLAMRRT
jgi:glycosyltransferase 2 family protein